jgi:hypothetical protein
MAVTKNPSILTPTIAPRTMGISSSLFRIGRTKTPSEGPINVKVENHVVAFLFQYADDRDPTTRPRYALAFGQDE